MVHGGGCEKKGHAQGKVEKSEEIRCKPVPTESVHEVLTRLTVKVHPIQVESDHNP